MTSPMPRRLLVPLAALLVVIAPACSGSEPEAEGPPPVAQSGERSSAIPPTTTTSAPPEEPPPTGAALDATLYGAVVLRAYDDLRASGVEVPPEVDVVDTFLDTDITMDEEQQATLAREVRDIDTRVEIVSTAEADGLASISASGSGNVIVEVGLAEEQADGTWLVPIDVFCGQGCGFSATYRAEGSTGSWNVTGPVGEVGESYWVDRRIVDELAEEG